MSDLAVIPWSKYGKKRLYVKTADGMDVGHIDLVTGAIVATADGFADQLAAIAIAHTGTPATPPPALRWLNYAESEMADICRSLTPYRVRQTV